MPRGRLSKSGIANRLGSWMNRRKARSASAAMNRALNCAIEPLEDRRLFTTITGSSGATPLEYVDNKGGTYRVTWNNVTAELIFVGVNQTNNAITVGDAVPPGGTANGANLFKIYVTGSDLSSWISIAAVPPITTPGHRAMQPFSGTAGPFLVTNAQGGQPVSIDPGGAGSALLGAEFAVGQNLATTPIYNVQDFGAHGVYPGEAGGLTAGLEVTPTNTSTGLPNDLGEFFFGGTIFGTVNVPAAPAGTVAAPASQGGNVGIFYAGAILTGISDGTFEGADQNATDNPVNFFIGGDIKDLITDGPIGGGGSQSAPPYVTGFSLQVAGTAGEIYLRQGSYYGGFNIVHDPSIYGLPDSLWSEQQYQFHAEGPTPPGDIFEGGNFAVQTLEDVQDPSGILPPRLPQPFNDSATPQYIGSTVTTDFESRLPAHDVNGKLVYATTVNGLLQDTSGVQGGADVVNNYAVPLLAGQTLTVTGFTQQELAVLIIDPDGRIVASDLNQANLGVTLDQAFQYTADRPGEYTVQVTIFPGTPPVGDVPYQLTFANIGDMGLGTIAAGAGSIMDAGFDTAFIVDHGSLGGMVASDNILSVTQGPTPVTPPAGVAPTTPLPRTVYVINGDLRAIVAGAIGFRSPNNIAIFGDDLIVDVPNGSIGLARATFTLATTEILALDTLIDEEVVGSTTSPNGTRLVETPVSPIGKDIQFIDAAATLFLNVAADGAIGDIRAGNMATNTPSYINVNADNKGFDGIIDLIDVRGNFGTISGGGPAILTNNGGDVRYIRVGGTVFQDEFFGGGSPTETVYNPAQTVTITDDSGSTAQFIPLGPSVTTTAVTTDITTGQITTATTVTGPQIAVTTYGIRDKAGVVVIDCTVDNPGANAALTGSGTAGTTSVVVSNNKNFGLNIVGSGAGGAGSHFEVGRIEIRGEGDLIDLATNANGTPTLDSNGNQTLEPISPSASNTNGGTTTTTTSTTGDPTLSLNISGPIDVDVLSAIAVKQDNSFVSLADVTTISNQTPRGEIVSTITHSIGTLSSLGTIGLAKHNTPMIMLPSEEVQFGTSLTGGTRPIFGTRPIVTISNVDVANAYPWLNQTTGILALWNIETITAGLGVGNILVQGSIGTLTAGALGKSIPGEFAGINGPIIPHNFANLPLVPLGGRLLQANIGEGILPSGSGAIGGPGIYAFGVVGTVTNNGRVGANIRGNVVSTTQLDNVEVANASIINTNIFVVSTIDQASPVFGAVQLPPGADQPITNPTFSLKNISVSGRGGIIGTYILATEVGPVTVSNTGFGILSSVISSGGNGVIGPVTAGGYGIRGTEFLGGAVVQSINATGNGKNLSVALFPADLRQSESSVGFDPFFGAPPNRLTDLDTYLGTTKDSPIVNNVTDTGVIEDVVALGSAFLNSLSAQSVRVSAAPFLPGPPPSLNIPAKGVQYSTSFNFADHIDSFVVRGVVDGLQITTGRIQNLSLHGSVSRFGLSVASRINNLTINGNFGQLVTDPATGKQIGDSYISAGGSDGRINRLVINGSLNGDVEAGSSIGELIVKGDVNGTIRTDGQAVTKAAIGTLRVYGNIADGSVTIVGSASRIITNGSLGTSTGTFTVQGDVGLLSVGAAHHVGNSLASALHVTGKVNSFNVFGRIDGAVTVDGDINSLNIRNDGAAANVLNSAMTVGGRLYKARIIGGNVSANIAVNGFIQSFLLTNGNVLANNVISSTVDSIKSLRIVGGSLLGSLSAVNGSSMNLDISGNFGDGVNAATIVGLSGNRFRIRGNMAALAGISLFNELKLLQVDGNIAAGATVSAHPLVKLVVGGTNAGTVTVV